MENEVVIHVRSEDETEKGFSSARRSAKKLGEDLERDLKQSGSKAGRGLADGISDGLARAKAEASRKADGIGDDVAGKLEKAGDKAGHGLGDGIGDGLAAAGPGIVAEAQLIGEAVESQMEESGQDAGRKLGEGIQDGLGGSGGKGLPPSMLSELIDSLGEAGARAGFKAGQGLVEQLQTAISAGAKNPAILAGMVTIGVAASGMIGSLLGAAVIGGGGALGIAGGFAAAAKDPRVKGASIALGDVISNDLEDAVDVFAPAAVEQIEIVRDAWKGILPDIESVFESSADLMDPLISGILDGVALLVSGIDDSLANAGPLFEAFGDLFRDVLGELGEMFTSLSDDTEDMASTVGRLGDIMVFTVDIMWAFVEGTTAVFGPLTQAADATKEWLHGLVGLGPEIGAVSLKGSEWHDVTEDATEAVNDQISALRELEETMRKQTDPLFEVFSLQVKVRKAQEAYNESLKDNGPHAAKTRKALVDMGKASFELTSALTSAAVEGFNGKLTPAMRTALRNADNTSAQIDALEKELIAAWKAALKWEGTYTQTYNVTRNEKVNRQLESRQFAHGGIVGAANGSTSSGTTMVGEHGPELVDLPPGTQVHSNPDSARMLSGNSFGSSLGLAGQGGQGGKLEIILRFDPSAAPLAVRGMMEGIRAEVRDGGGSVQTVLGVAGVS